MNIHWLKMTDSTNLDAWRNKDTAEDISQICSVGIVRYLAELGLDARIKWPNDIYIGDRKICGMLIENTLKDDTLAVSIAGIGLNVNQKVFPPDLPNPTSVLLALDNAVTGREGTPGLSPEEELPRLLHRIFELYGQMDADGHVPGLDEEYSRLLYRKGIPAEFEETEYVTGGGLRRFRGRILGVEKGTARLLVEKEDGQVAKYYFKEIRFVL